MSDWAVHFVWALAKATLFLSIAAGVARLVLGGARADSARTQGMVWILVLLQGWLVFSIAIAVPYSRHDSEARPPLAIESRSEHFSEVPHLTARSEGAKQIDVEQRELPLAGSVIVEKASPPWDWGIALFAVWLLGAIGVLLLQARRRAGFVRAVPLGEEPIGVWREEWESLSKHYGVLRLPALRVTSEHGPMLCRISGKALVLVPKPLWERLGPAEREAILRHELLHYLHGDLWKSLAARLLVLPHWFNPLAWMAARRFEQCREWLCDDGAAGGIAAGRIAYAKTLLAALELAQGAANSAWRPAAEVFSNESTGN